jgi:hypothetical protein
VRVSGRETTMSPPAALAGPNRRDVERAGLRNRGPDRKGARQGYGLVPRCGYYVHIQLDSRTDPLCGPLKRWGLPAVIPRGHHTG